MSLPPKKKPWWCSGQHTRSGILSPYARLPKILILSLEGREVAGSNPAHGDLFFFYPSLPFSKVGVTAFCSLFVSLDCSFPLGFGLLFLRLIVVPPSELRCQPI